jgi:hypothetical protein
MIQNMERISFVQLFIIIAKLTVIKLITLLNNSQQVCVF